MNVLIDTNVLLRLAKPDDPSHDVAANSLLALHDRGDTPTMIPQVCYEYYVVATRPVANNGLGLAPEQAGRDVDDLVRRLRFLRDERTVFEEWRRLVEDHSVAGKQAHDARIVAAMVRHGLSHLLTFNAADFRRFSGTIDVLDPAAIASRP